MSKWLALLGAAIFGSAEWWLGARVGIMTAFMASVVSAGLGIYVGRRIASQY